MSAADDQDELPSAAVPAESAKNSSRPLEAGGFAAEALEIARRVKQISRNEAHLTAGCGYNTKKKLLLSAFWDGMWPELTSIGWQKVRLISLLSVAGLSDEESYCTSSAFLRGCPWKDEERCRPVFCLHSTFAGTGRARGGGVFFFIFCP